MSKKKIEQIKDDFQELINEAEHHTQKKQRNAFFGHSFKASPEKVFNHYAKNKVSQLEKNVNKKNIKKKSEKVSCENFSNKEQVKNLKKAQKKIDVLPKKKRKSHWQNNESQTKSHVTVLDKRIDLKQLNGKSVLCIGGVKSGKSDFALDFGNMYKGKKAFIATMQKPQACKASKKNDLKSEKLQNTFMGGQSITRHNVEEQSAVEQDIVKNMFRIHTLLDNEQSIFKQSLQEQEQVQSNMRIDEKISKTLSSDLDEIKICEAYAFEVEERILKHQNQRNEEWSTFEEAFNVKQVILSAKEKKFSVALVDCISLWITNLLLANKTDDEIFAEVEELCKILSNPPIPVILVSNEVGLGTGANNELEKRFRQLQGKANQILAKHCQIVIFSISGLPLLMKG